MSADLCLRGGHIIDPATGLSRRGSLYIRDGCIYDIAPLDEDLPAREFVDCDGLLVCPGLVDIHVHLRQPGAEHKEDIASGTRAALAGGFTSVVCMPNTSPRLATPEIVRELADAIDRDAICRVFIAAAAVNEDGTLTDFSGLKRAGAAAISDDGMALQDEALMAEALDRCRREGLVFICHPEIEAAGPAGPVNAGPVAEQLGVPGMAPEREVEGIRAWGRAAEQLSGRPKPRLHIAHVSSAAALDAVEELRRSPAFERVTCETCPHYLVLDERAVLEIGANAKMTPPLRSAKDRQALVEATREGRVDAIATDHAPHAPEEKARGLVDAPFGIIGLETAVGVLFEHLVHRRGLRPERLIELLSYGPARAIGLPRGVGSLHVGSPADITLIDPSAEWEIDPERFYSKSRNTPFAGWRVRGRVVAVYRAGELVAEDGKVLV